jgi:hypothetical protein|tara:strand:- start:121 stop:474 length:354 start_codon:yes stop_codon:yes gene_type:complete
MLLGQTLIKSSRKHASGLMSELFDLSERRLEWWSLLAKAMSCQQRHQLIQLFIHFRPQIQVFISSVLAHGRFLSKGSCLPNSTRNLLDPHPKTPTQIPMHSTRASLFLHPQDAYPTF